MAGKKKGKKRKFRWRRWARRGLVALGGLFGLVLLIVLLFRFAAPPTNLYQFSEAHRLGGIEREWVSIDDLPTFIPLSAAAAEDADFCAHWGFDLSAIRDAWAGGARRGGSTISQQTAKNVFLWQGRSWVRKGLEAGFTVLIEALWPKRRIVEVYLNVAEFDTGVFGIEAAARHHFGVPAAQLSRTQAARLMAVLPDPKGRSAVRPSAFTQRRTRVIVSGAQTLAADGRGACMIR
ncbi:monofunctional biosynthetic peptidoglycan transglycosylase [Halovulum sp. GXIMD14794]